MRPRALHQGRRSSGGLAAVALALTVWSAPSAQLRPAPDALDAAAPSLVQRLREDPYVYFRFINRPWIERVCRAFAADLPSMPVAGLQGDAHLEQFALTEDAWGLDDFDDAARGPAIVDIVRFLGSVDLAARQRGWTGRRDALFDRFFDGYRRGLENPGYRTPEPAIVHRLRAGPVRSPAEFLAWGESRMQPMSPEDVAFVERGLRVFTELLKKEQPDLPSGYLTLVRAGWLHMGVGSAGLPKFLMRIQGPTDSPDDDQLLEAKRLADVASLPCIRTAIAPPTLRVVEGARNLGRLNHNILVGGPAASIPEWGVKENVLSNWWIRSWDPSYREVSIGDLQSADDLGDITSDAGVQLAEGSFHEEAETTAAAHRTATLAMLKRLEPKIRRVTVSLVDDTIAGWKMLSAAERTP